MSIYDNNVIDAIGIRKDGSLGLLLTDHIDWSNESDELDEYNHLITLQDKINHYLMYIEGKQYKDSFPDTVFENFVIEIFFKYRPSDNCYKFLNVAAAKITNLSTTIEITITNGKDINTWDGSVC